MRSSAWFAIAVGSLLVVVEPGGAAARGAKRRSSGLKRTGKKPVCSPDSVTVATRIARLRATLKIPHAANQRTALFKLGFFRHPKAIQAIVEVLRDKKAKAALRAHAASTLARLPCDATVKALRAATKFKSKVVAKSARKGLAQVCPRKLKGKRLYVRLKIPKKGKGITGEDLTVLSLQLHRVFSTDGGIVIGWRRCAPLIESDLAKQRVRAVKLLPKLSLNAATVKETVHLQIRAERYNEDEDEYQPGSVVLDVKSTSKTANPGDQITAILQAEKRPLLRFLGTIKAPAQAVPPTYSGIYGSTSTSGTNVTINPNARGRAQVRRGRRQLPTLLPSSFRSVARNSAWLRLQQRANRKTLSQVDRLLKKRKASQAHAHLARLLRRSPDHRGARERLALVQSLMGNHLGSRRTLRWIESRFGEAATSRIRRRIRALRSRR